MKNQQQPGQMPQAVYAAQALLGVVVVSMIFFLPIVMRDRSIRPIAAAVVVAVGLLIAVVSPRHYRSWGFVLATSGAVVLPMWV
ncbi:hypothetical protein GCM10009624_30760 [Gordonia sinesedis]